MAWFATGPSPDLMAEAGPIERLLRRDRLITALALLVLCVAAWIYLLSGAGMGASVWRGAPSAAGASGMDSMAGMSGMAAPAAAASPENPGRDLLIGVVMWWSMMIAMMAPSAAPMVLLYARVARMARHGDTQPVLAHTGWFVAGYLGLWLLFSVAATLLQHGLTRLAWLSPSMSVENVWFDAGILILAGLYQLSPVHEVCLRHCRAPAAFLSQHYRPGVVGALRLGELHGAYCLGCCWLLMAVLFVGGVMNLAWIAALTLLIAAQKILPGGRWVGVIAGLGLIAWGVASLFGPATVGLTFH